MKRLTKTFAVWSLALLIVAGESGCATSQAIHSTKGSSHKNEKGEVVVDEKPQPAIYAIVPLAVAADTILLPVYGVTAIIVLTMMATGGWPKC